CQSAALPGAADRRRGLSALPQWPARLRTHQGQGCEEEAEDQLQGLTIRSAARPPGGRGPYSPLDSAAGYSPRMPSPAGGIALVIQKKYLRGESMQADGTWLGLSIAAGALAVVYGIISMLSILKLPAGNARMQEI